MTGPVVPLDLINAFSFCKNNHCAFNDETFTCFLKDNLLTLPRVRSNVDKTIVRIHTLTKPYCECILKS